MAARFARRDIRRFGHLIIPRVAVQSARVLATGRLELLVNSDSRKPENTQVSRRCLLAPAGRAATVTLHSLSISETILVTSVRSILRWTISDEGALRNAKFLFRIHLRGIQAACDSSNSRRKRYKHLVCRSGLAVSRSANARSQQPCGGWLSVGPRNDFRWAGD